MTFEEQFHQVYEDLLSIDMNQLESLYHKDIKFIDPITTHQGIAAVKDYFSQLLTSADICRFTIHSMLNCTAAAGQPYSYVVEWTMQLRLKNKTTMIHVDGVSMLKVCDGKIRYHRDYYDLGEMVYEHIPVLRRIIHYIKKKLDA